MSINPFKVGDTVRATSVPPGTNNIRHCPQLATDYTVCVVDGMFIGLAELQIPDERLDASWYHWRFTTVDPVPMTCKVSAHKKAYRAPARANDPATSKGKKRVNKYEQAVLNCLSGGHYEPREQGWTGKEIAEETGHPLNCITPRFAPLRRKGLIKDSGVRRDKQIVWMLA